MSLFALLCAGRLSAEEPLEVKGSFNLKKRVKGEIIETVKWYPLPEFLDEHMGIPRRFKVIGKKIEGAKLILSFTTKKTKPVTKALSLKDNQTDEGFNFINFYYEYISGNEGALKISIEDKKKNKVYERVIPTRGDAG